MKASISLVGRPIIKKISRVGLILEKGLKIASLSSFLFKWDRQFKINPKLLTLAKTLDPIDYSKGCSQWVESAHITL